jgi:arginase
VSGAAAPKREMRLHALVVPMDSGHRRWRMGAGPERLIERGLLDGARARGVEVTVERYDPRSPKGEVGSAIEIAGWLSERVVAARGAGAFPLVLSGNCASSLGTLAGLTQRTGRQPGVCWFDAHADFNTPETTESGFFDGMALAAGVGRCWTRLTATIPGFRAVPESRVLLLGARALDTAEERALSASAVRRVSAGDEPDEATQQLGTLRIQVRDVYLHIDLDTLDPSEGTVNVYSCPGGFTRQRLVEIVAEIAGMFDVAALALTAYDPAFDRDNRIPPIARQLVETVLLARDSA